MTRIAIITAALAAASVALGGVVPLDPHSEEPLREQIARAVQSGPTTAPTTAQSVMADVDRQLAAIEGEVERLRALGEPAKPRADRLQRRLNELRERRNGKAFPTSDQPELHMVVVHGNPAEANKHLPPAQRRRQFKAARTPVTVEVQPIGRPIVLVVCSYGPTQWDVRIANDANVKRVIVGGYETQQVTGAPENVPVEVHTYEGPRRSAHHFYTMGPGTEGHDAAMAKLRALTSMEVATFQVKRHYAGGAIVVGPGSDEWAAQRLQLDLRPVYHEAVAYSLARQREALRDVRFKAVRVAPPAPPPQPAQAPRPPVAAGAGVRVMVGPRRAAAFSLAEFTPAGPIEGSDVPLSPRVTHVAVDPNDATVYAIDSHQVYRIDSQTGRSVPIEFDAPDLPRISWCSGLTFDTKRRRLVLSTMNTLYAYDPAARKWSGIVDLEQVRAVSFTYSAAHDCFYAVLADMGGSGGPVRLLRYTADGDADRLIELPRTFVAQPYRPDTLPQLIAAGEQLAFIPPSPFQSHGPAPVDPAQSPRMKCTLIDPLTGNVTYSGPMEPHAGKLVKLTQEELDVAWRALASDEPEEAERALSRLVSAGDQAVQHVRANLAPPEPIDPEKVRSWIAQLDRDDFAAREAANSELRRLGRRAEPLLRAALENNPSAESATRLNALLAELNAPAAAQASRDARVADLLARIGTPAAIDLLGDWSAGPDETPITTEARRALTAFARD